MILPKNRNEKEAWLLGLLFKCPVTQTNPHSCHIHDMRQNLDKTKYVDYIRSLPDANLDELIIKHAFCDCNHK